MDRACQNCRFAHINWLKGEPYKSCSSEFPYREETYLRCGTSVQCRINPPVKAIRENDQDGWPWVSGDDFCGEFQPKDQTHD